MWGIAGRGTHELRASIRTALRKQSMWSCLHVRWALSLADYTTQQGASLAGNALATFSSTTKRIRYGLVEIAIGVRYAGSGFRV